jgi:hypothetical protein
MLFSVQDYVDQFFKKWTTPVYTDVGVRRYLCPAIVVLLEEACNQIHLARDSSILYCVIKDIQKKGFFSVFVTAWSSRLTGDRIKFALRDIEDWSNWVDLGAKILIEDLAENDPEVFVAEL